MQDCGDHADSCARLENKAAETGVFVTTHWTVVQSLGSSDPEAASAALERLCRVYWFPIYAFIRRRRNVAHAEAEDLAQGFFQHLIERETLRRATRDKGRFRTFLLGALSHFLNNEWDKQRRLKRGGGIEFVSLDEVAAEALFARISKAESPPSSLFDRQWAATLVNRVLSRLGQGYAEEGHTELYRILEPALTQPDTDGLYAECATRLGMKEGAARVALHRLRGRFRELLRAEVAETVGCAEDIEDELRHLVAAIAAGRP